MLICAKILFVEYFNNKSQIKTKFDLKKPISFYLKEGIINSLSDKKEIEILTRRFGILGKEPETLESIGKSFGVTRERIRQIEKNICKKLGTSPQLKKVFEIIVSNISNKGGIITIEALEYIFKLHDRESKSLLKIAMECFSGVFRIENASFKESWVIKNIDPKLISDIANFGESILKETQKPINKKVFVGEILNKIKSTNETKTYTLVQSTLSSAKNIGTTPDGEYGLTKWGIVNPKNTRDKAYIIFKKTGKPLHYKKITEMIKNENFSPKVVGVEAVHNELIRDPRFILIGRGIYALKEWGYKTGTVCEVIEEIFKEENKPLHKDEIIKRVLEKRLVKRNTILLNLQEKPQFERVKRATYKLRSEKK